MESGELEVFGAAVERATRGNSGAALDAALADLGWFDALRADPAAAVSVLFERQGAARATSCALDRVLAESLGREEHAAVVLPPLRRHSAPGLVDGGRWTVLGLGTATLAAADRVLVVASDDTGAGGEVACSVAGGTLELRPVHGLDPALGLVEVRGVLDPGNDPSSRPGRVDWDQAVARGQLAVGHELVGTARTMLELAREHALARVQFGHPIASFQAVRHRLAESLVAIESAAGLLAAAWEDPSPAVAAMAKGLAGRSARTVARHAQQVLAGIGFTTEHPLHEYVRRTLVLDQLLGAGSVLTKEVGTEVLRTGALPAALPL